jgi:hypothetical protein
MTEEELKPLPIISLNSVHWIARRFDLSEPFKISDFPGKGNIHRQTFLISAGHLRNIHEYVLQMLNTEVFTRPDTVMDTMISCIRAQNKALSERILQRDEGWECIRLIPTKDGAAYLETDDSDPPQYWRMMARIRNARSYGSLNEIPSPGERLRIAEEAGKGLALFRTLTAGMNAKEVPEPLPGYRNTGLYYDQLDSILKGSRTLEESSVRLPSDPTLRESTGRHFLVQLDPHEYRIRMKNPQVCRLAALALENRSYCLKLQRKLKSGNLRTVIVHGDTKLDNFLFCTITGKVKTLVDLDTVMPHTWLSDWGDMTRSLINVSGEKLANPDEIKIDLDIFKALAKGFIETSTPLPRHEVELMVDAARIMALELGVRFLTDYVRGDTYFRLGAGDPADLNRIRAAVQFSLFQALGRRSDEARSYIADLYGAAKNRLPG